jgi:uncharacterized protein
MKIAGLDVKPGTIKRGFVETSGYVDGIRLRIPVIVACGTKRGKKLAVVAGQHGRELNGPAAIYKTIQGLRPKQMAGSIVFFPAVNHLSMRQTMQDYPTEYPRYFRSQEQHLHLNVNRTWPGDAKGTLQQRMTHAVWNAGAKQADAVIDLHAWSERTVGLAWSNKRGADLRRAFAFPWSFERDEVNPTDGMLEAACVRVKKPCVVCEITPQDIVNGQGVCWGMQGLTNVARHMGILPGAPEFPWPRYELGGGVGMVSEKAGLVVTTHQVGDVLEPGEAAVELVDLETFKPIQVGRPPERMILRRVGGVWREGYIGYHYVQPNETIATFAKIVREWPADAD